MYLWRPKNGLISYYRSSNDIEKIKIYIVDLCEELKVDLIVGKWIYNNLDADVMVIKCKDEYNEIQFLGNICRVKDI